jgi:hypothetical protein
MPNNICVRCGGMYVSGVVRAELFIRSQSLKMGRTEDEAKGGKRLFGRGCAPQTGWNRWTELLRSFLPKIPPS